MLKHLTSAKAGSSDIFLFSFNTLKHALTGERARGHSSVRFIASLSHSDDLIAIMPLQPPPPPPQQCVFVCMWQRGRANTESPVTTQGSRQKVPPRCSRRLALCDYICILSADKLCKSTLNNDTQVLKFRHGPKRGRQIVLSVLCFSGTWMSLHHFHFCILVISFLISQ